MAAAAQRGRRHRAQLEGGYRRTTVSIPEELGRRVDDQLRAEPGVTMSAFVSDALELALKRKPKRRW